MKRDIIFTLSIGFFILLFSCSSPQFIHDSKSLERQRELQNTRSTNVISEILVGTASVVTAATFNGSVEWYPSEQQFKNLNLENPTSDTIYVNMLTDIFWDKNDYCDFMDIRIPPKESCKILVPVRASYNLYFSNTPEKEDDEMVEIFTSKIKNIYLRPGSTIISQTSVQKD